MSFRMQHACWRKSLASLPDMTKQTFAHGSTTATVDGSYSLS